MLQTKPYLKTLYQLSGYRKINLPINDGGEGILSHKKKFDKQIDDDGNVNYNEYGYNYWSGSSDYMNKTLTIWFQYDSPLTTNQSDFDLFFEKGTIELGITLC